MDRATRCSGVFVGEGTLLIQCAEIFADAGHDVRAVVSAEPKVTSWAEQRQVAHLAPDVDLVAALAARPFDYLFSVANLAILPADVVALPRKLAVNFHDALLPRYAGLHATSWALIGREASHGVTWHEMAGAVDAGRILRQRAVEIADDETAVSLNAKCYEAGIGSFAELVADISADALTFADPRLAERTYFGKSKRPRAACTLSWDRPSEELGALVRALDFGPYANPLGLPKVYLGGEALVVRELDVLDSASGLAPGTIVSVATDAIRVATAGRDVVLRALRTIDGQPLAASDLAARFGLCAGDRLPTLGQADAERLTDLNERLSRYEDAWSRRLASLDPVELPYANRSAAAASAAGVADATMPIPAELVARLAGSDADWAPSDFVLAAFAAYLARLGGKQEFDLGFADPALARALAGLEGFFATQVPLHVALDGRDSGDGLRALRGQLEVVRRRVSYPRDLVARRPELQPLLARGGQPHFPIAIACAEDPERYAARPGNELTLVVSPDGAACRWLYDPTVFSAEDVAAMQLQFARFLVAAATDSGRALGDEPLLSEAERSRVLVEWNATTTPYPENACVHQLFEAQADATPDAVAVVCEDQQLSYRELDARANRVAAYLRKLGVGPDVLVGVCMDRSLEMVVALIGIHKAGGAYVPLDPTYPRERLNFMADDGGLAVLVTQARLASRVPAHGARVVCLDSEWDAIARESADRPHGGASPDNLAYVIYTSGSTGKPKGVMVEHRNVVNFFAGMDERLDRDPPGVWMAVTSLSFDISVLELFWTLARGFTVVLHVDRDKLRLASGPRNGAASKGIAFSLAYFASDERDGGSDKYRLLMEGARFADRHGFSAVWTPERHFHAFGGLYPNPSVASAAIAAVTERIQIRAGSVVLPLHSPIRVAEEWSLVDNLSQGRVGISFASGWQPDDFALAPHAFADRKNLMVREIETVRRLWRGEGVSFPGPTGDVEVRTLPRPVQSELPTWITAAGSPETFRLAGELGAGLLTHLLGQSVEELADKLAIYRAAWRERGHPGNGHVTLMLHTFVGTDDQEVRETVREPMKAYLRSSVDLIKKAAWTFPAFANSLQATGKNPGEVFESGELSVEEMEALLDHAFERYFRTSGLFGTPETCLEMVEKLKAIEVDEIACLIDFGVDPSVVLEHLPALDELRTLSNPADSAGRPDYSIPAQLARHGVTHLQCTPSMASMLLLDERAHAAFRPLKNVMIGGEAFPPALARQLTELVSGDVINMYGPTETTIWSSTHRLDAVEATIPIGRPIANTTLYILDRDLRPVPVGVPGELFIGGAGVVRGYLGRPELTAERFIHDPFSDEPGARLYRTGDLARYRRDGTVEFLGRIDHQVKIRGYRIELGEIEALLQQHPSVQEAVVVAREDVPGDKRLVAYVVPAGPAQVAAGELRGVLNERLPDFMVPSHIVQLTALPLTPNAKIDRKALPAPDHVEAKRGAAFVAPENDLETTIARVWQEALHVAQVGVNDNFFELGGHSLLMVQVQHTLRRVLERDVKITDLFRFPTIRSLTIHLERGGDDRSALQQSVDRAEARRELLQRRRQLRQTVAR